MRDKQNTLALVISSVWLLFAVLAYWGVYVPTIEQIAGTQCFAMAWITWLVLSK